MSRDTPLSGREQFSRVQSAVHFGREMPNRELSASNREQLVLNRESTLIGREQMNNMVAISEIDSGPLTIDTHSSIPQILVFLLAPNFKEPIKSFSSIKASIDYLNQFKDPSQLIKDEQAILALVDINDLYRKKS